VIPLDLSLPDAHGLGTFLRLYNITEHGQAEDTPKAFAYQVFDLSDEPRQAIDGRGISAFAILWKWNGFSKCCRISAGGNW
jgi:hypothetical protein